jgi:hypothetical protein
MHGYILVNVRRAFCFKEKKSRNLRLLTLCDFSATILEPTPLDLHNESLGQRNVEAHKSKNNMPDKTPTLRS